MRGISEILHTHSKLFNNGSCISEENRCRKNNSDTA